MSTLTVQSAAHAHTVDAVALTQASVLTVQGAVHGVTSPQLLVVPVVGSASLYVNGVEYEPQEFRVAYQDRDAQQRAMLGPMRSAARAVDEVGRTESYQIRWALLTDAERTALVDDLRSGAVTLQGALLDGGGPVRAVPTEPMTVRRGPLADQNAVAVTLEATTAEAAG